MALGYGFGGPIFLSRPPLKRGRRLFIIGMLFCAAFPWVLALATMSKRSAADRQARHTISGKIPVPAAPGAKRCRSRSCLFSIVTNIRRRCLFRMMTLGPAAPSALLISIAEAGQPGPVLHTLWAGCLFLLTPCNPLIHGLMVGNGYVPVRLSALCCRGGPWTPSGSQKIRTVMATACRRHILVWGPSVVVAPIRLLPLGSPGRKPAGNKKNRSALVRILLSWNVKMDCLPARAPSAGFANPAGFFFALRALGTV